MIQGPLYIHQTLWSIEKSFNSLPNEPMEKENKVEFFYKEDFPDHHFRVLLLSDWSGISLLSLSKAMTVKALKKIMHIVIEFNTFL